MPPATLDFLGGVPTSLESQGPAPNQEMSLDIIFKLKSGVRFLLVVYLAMFYRNILFSLFSYYGDVYRICNFSPTEPLEATVKAAFSDVISKFTIS